MPRRSRSNANNAGRLAVYVMAGGALVAILVFGKFILDKRAQHFPNLKELSVAELKESGTSLSGNEYRITGEIAERMILAGDHGLLISVNAERGGKQSSLVPVHIPPGINQINLERGHNYAFKVEVNREGLPVAMDIKAE